MKNLKTLVLAWLLAVSGSVFAQNAQPATAPAKKQTKTEKTQAPAGTKLKKDGTPDKRYAENKKLKKDGTPDKRYKEHKDTVKAGKKPN
ncbi:hypothetical protein DYBT9275_05925 [Dyadobacter sp. CECT 9275]|uniref:Uncharacterized protein n=1 Tax=Dyadobacter helix TaxID=2822344 RepID=A0A916JIP1_9BACT|nr:hypothetical protein [Dyadobacter sp. CECT 9275]CAG5018095.1 hypothetical protein DYBT9275_05925 [Dyadobacter sp. CECT 9275]